ncbi:MAG: prephenate dehydrogenase [Lachnospiraceae bacterium]|nr:prephenate dehydrogenase [Lachnospiraceae bacterium]MBO4762327.1 prephenate dehydrogenase [Lachnospiraceae bacterium]MBQ6091921.1 prephenate dehydrogenase [Lachnospiraceae bacterium]MBR5368546.1 prephenate dehydrogenase [Lachnospiraceae bacterium]
MRLGVVGLGLIGGSFAKAYKKDGHEVMALDTDKKTLGFAALSGAIDGELTDEIIPTCDLILICTYPEAAISFMTEKGPIFGKRPVVIDACGTKEVVVKAGMELAGKYGFTYVGGHPMAGTQFSGFKYAKENLYKGAPMVIIPPVYDDPVFLDNIKKLLAPAGFGKLTITTAEEHDKVIAFTSQLAHVVSNAYVKSPSSRLHSGLSAGSYKDLTRVAWLNPGMWTQLFMENSENLIFEIDTLIANLKEYRDAIEAGDKDTLYRILDEGRKIKEEVDG